MRILDRIRTAMAAGHNTIPLGRAMGFQAVEVSEGHAIIEMETCDHHLNTLGRLHGGVLCTIADTAMGIAHVCSLPAGEASATVEMKINFLRPVASGTRLRAEGKVIQQGKTISLVECSVHDAEQKLVARASGTFMAIPYDRAKPAQQSERAV